MINKLLNKLSFLRCAKIFFYLFFAFLPFQISALLLVSDVYYSGFFNPYSSHFIYLTDIFLLVSLVLLSLSFAFREKGTEKIRFFNNRRLLMFIGVYIALNAVSIIFSVDYVNATFSVLRVVEFGLVYLLITSGFVGVKKLMYVFIGVVSFVSFIGIFQYMFQESLGLRFLGEPLISSEKLGVAKVGLKEGNFLRVYGTFPHPNIFAGYLSFAIFFIIYCFKEAKVLFTTLLIVCLIALVLTFSRSAILALFMGLFLYYAVSNVKITFKNASLFVVLFLFFIVTFDLYSVLVDRIVVGDQGSLAERSLQYSASKHMFFDNVFGVGLGNFTLVMQNYLTVKLQPWLIQPVHNLLLLSFNEIGLLGGSAFVALFAYVFYKLLKIKTRLSYILMSIWVFVLVVGLFDHYFLTLYQGNVLLWMFLGLVGRTD